MTRREMLREAARVAGALSLTGGVFAASAWGQAPARPKKSNASKEDTAGEIVEAFLQAPIVLTPLGQNVSLLTGPGGNIAALTGPEVLLVDAGVAGRSAGIIKAVAGITPLPIRTVINTHWHFDHAGGNEALARQGARIISSANTRRRLTTPQKISILGAEFPAAPPSAWPTSTFSADGTLYFPHEEVQLFSAPAAHTDGDLFVYFLAADVLHAGDVFYNGIYPPIDYDSNGWIGGMIAGADHILALTGEKTKIIPGHGALASRSDLLRFRAMLETTRARIEPMIAAGETENAVAASAPTRDLDAEWGHGFLTGEQFTRIVYRGLVKHSLAAL